MTAVSIFAASLLAVGLSILGAAAITMARMIVLPPQRRRADVRVLGVDADAGTVRLSITPDSAVDGQYSLWFDDDRRHALAGPIVERDADSVTRSVSAEHGRLPRPGDLARLGAWVYRHPSELGLPFEELAVATELGEAPAWLIPAPHDAGRWVIHVHGRGVQRQECLRAVPVFHEHGYHSLVVSYRNDGEAPQSRDHRLRLGAEEWLDVDAALRLAIDRGARSVVIMGWSMGGAIALQTVTRSPAASYVDGLVLESPVIDWVDTIRLQGDLVRMPRPVTTAAVRLLTSPLAPRLTGVSAPIDFDSLDFVARAGELRTPTLLLHSDEDGFVPPAPSRALARSRPDLVTYRRWRTARHTRLWNLDRNRWEQQVSDWLRGLESSSQ
ncbi:alpha/beta hydrolase family protein [Ruicaihuangia caeni]|uniref:Alpha/beta fold hydrolase n=1 Tax=Ruicaihuangia caeni TaxID=3042517 RepID=A0AAW6T7F9_9MICO|nr:alpha/beta fold hydrolase [Klugiella sp. YN-L-19]MDI2098035.1 alpha/beta fold hydrolase [Klugiella sp. YN-L-19]